MKNYGPIPCCIHEAECERLRAEVERLRALCAEADDLMDGYVDRCNITRVQLRAVADGRLIPATDAHRSEEDIRQITEA